MHGETVFVVERDGFRERLVALDVPSGRERWSLGGGLAPHFHGVVWCGTT